MSRRISQPVGLDGIDQAVYRSFEASESGFMDVLTGSLVFAVGIGMEADTVDSASRAVDFLPEALTAVYGENVEGTSGETVEASVGRLGDERIGLATTFSLDDDEFIEEFTLGTIVVRKDRYLQILVGASTFGPLGQLAAIAGDIKSRWSSTEIWTIVPELADMPVGMVLDEEGEFNIEDLNPEDVSADDDANESENPEVRELEAGSLTFSVELLVTGLYLEADEAANTCSGAGFYDVVDAGSEFTIVDSETDELLYTAILSAGTLQASSCAWTIAVLGLPSRPGYEFFVGYRQIGSVRLEDVQSGETIKFEKKK